MAKNIQIKIKNNGQYEECFPITKAELVAGLESELATKVTKVEGKQLTTNDFTNDDKKKLDGVADGANKTMLSDSVSSESSSIAASSKAVKKAYDTANHKHNYLDLNGTAVNSERLNNLTANQIIDSITKDSVGLPNVENIKQASKEEFDKHITDKNIHKSSSDIRSDSTVPLVPQVVNELPKSVTTNIIYNNTNQEYYIGKNGEWVSLSGNGVNTESNYTKEEKDKLSELDVHSIKEINKDNPNKIWVGTKAEYDILTEIEKSNNNITFYITDDVVQEGGAEIQELQTTVDRNTTNIQQLENTKANVSDIPTKTSQLENDSKFAVKSDIPTQTSQLNNDSGFITSVNIPTKTSELTNDSGFISKIPQATTEIGGIRANPKTELDTTEIRIDNKTGYLYCSGGGSGGGIEAPTNGNTKFGLNAMEHNITDGINDINTAYGDKALKSNTTGYGHTAIGEQTLMDMQTKTHNTAVGYQACNHSQERDNTGIGAFSLRTNITGVCNTSVGSSSLSQIKQGDNNTALGYASLLYTFDGKLLEYIKNCTGIGSQTSVSGDNQVQLGDSSTTTYCYGAIQNRSDRRDKADIQETTLGLSFINNLRPVEFKWDYRDDYFKDELQKDGTVKRVPIPKDGSKKRNRPHQGFIAQEVKQLADELNIDFGGYQDHSINGGCDVLSLGYEEFIAPMVKAIQEQQQMIEELKTELQTLKNNK